MQSGDRIQVSQFDAGRTWIYARVLQAFADGSALVQVEHPANIEHGVIKFVKATGMRTKADVQALADEWKYDTQLTAKENANEKAGLLHQVEELS